MSFWEEDNHGETISICEEAIFQMNKSIRSIAELYEKKLDRRPNKYELEQLIKYGLSMDLGNLLNDDGQNEIVEVKLKIKKATKKTLIKEGNIIAIPINEGSHYIYGEIKKALPGMVYMDYYNLVTTAMLDICNFKERNPDYLVTILTGAYSILNKEWPIIGHIPREPNSYVIPDFSSSIDDKYYISKGESNNSEKRIFVDETEAKKVKNPDGLYGSEIAAYYVEQLLIE